MDRRSLLAAAGTAGALSVSGCLSATESLPTPSEETEDDGETHLHFREGGERIATLTVKPGRGRTPGPVPVDVSIWHRGGTVVSSLSLRLRAPPAGGDVPAPVALVAPGWSPGPPLRLHTDPRDGGAVLRADGLRASGTVTFEFLVSPRESPAELSVAAAFDLEERELLGGNYEATARTRVPLP